MRAPDCSVFNNLYMDSIRHFIYFSLQYLLLTNISDRFALYNDMFNITYYSIITYYTLCH